MQIQGPTIHDHNCLRPPLISLVFALWTISEKRKLDLTDREIAESVQKVGGGTPCDNSIRMWRERFEADPEWYPGKQAEDVEKPGRKKVITKLQEPP